MADHDHAINKEPSGAPQPNRWYDITLGPSFRDTNQPSTRFCTLRHEFKPASIDKKQPGSLHKSKDNRVTVGYQNNQRGKPKVTFDGVCEDYNDNDAVLFFDGQAFRLERLHRAVKRLRHVRLPGEYSTGAASVGQAAELHSPPVSKRPNHDPPRTREVHALQVEQIDVNAPNGLDSVKGKQDLHPSSYVNPPVSSCDPDGYESEEYVNIDDEDDHNLNISGKIEINMSEKEPHRGALDTDINLPHPADEDDEMVDVDVCDDVTNEGPNAAEALRAQVNVEWRKQLNSGSSSSSGASTSSGSESSSGSGSDSSSTDSESSSDSSCSDGESSSDSSCSDGESSESSAN